MTHKTNKTKQTFELIKAALHLPAAKKPAAKLPISFEVGDIRDEYDDHEDEISHEERTGDFEVDGLISIEDLIEQTKLDIPEGPYETASGFVMHFLGRIPREHDVVNVNGIRITVLSMEGKRAGQLLISRSA